LIYGHRLPAASLPIFPCRNLGVPINKILTCCKYPIGGDGGTRTRAPPFTQPIYDMNEPLSELIRIRVTPRQYHNLNEAATLSGLKLSEYVRRLLITAESLQSELNQLREITDSLQRSQKTENAILETLFLLRCSVSSDQLSSAQKLLNDLGFKTF